jgi:Tfp pilus assembly protein PilV
MNGNMRNERPMAGLVSPRKRSGQSLVEVLVALCVLGLIIPSSLEAFGVAFAVELQLRERERKMAYAEWWFNRLEFPATRAQIDAAPRVDESGAIHFDWEVESREYDALQVILHVSNGTGIDVPFTMSRVY